MTFDTTDMHAALMHELKNNLGLLTMTLDGMPVLGIPEHDTKLDEARLICQRSVERLQQALLIYKADRQALHPIIDAYSPHDLLREMGDNASSLARNRLDVEILVGEQVPDLWFFDRSLVEMAILNAIHNALAYAKTTIRIEADMHDDYLAFTVRDDSQGYPEQILAYDGAQTYHGGQGTGLGLRFAQLIAELHKNQGRVGSLKLYNDAGAVFSLLLP
ncbi:MAG: ATP-binding protein [Pseudomonadota bacterium]|nr:ATP-binding protein [Pseudomonadota bacterium]MDP1905492.1 ATP-binding protein [Pseudomonadota bacterium]MDP2353692.1 ATP-binding protein [Pseudomonadota bacterium]